MTQKPVTIAANIWPGYELMFLAQREEWFNVKKVQIIETASMTASIELLKQGKADGAALTLDEVLKARAEGLPLSVVLILDLSAGSDMLLARADIRQLSDLKGRTIAYDGTLGEIMLIEVLRAAGLTRKDIVPLPVPIEQQMEAWQQRQADAFITYEPIASQLVGLGAVRLFDSRQIPNLIVDVLAIHRRALDRAHAEAIRDLVAGHLRAVDHLMHNPQDAAYRVSAHLKLPVDKVLPVFKGMVLTGADRNHRLLSGSPPPLLIDARRLAAILIESRLLLHDDPMHALIDASYLPLHYRVD